MDILNVLELLEQTSSKNDQLNLLKQYKTIELADVLHAAFTFTRKFGVKKFLVNPLNNMPMIDAHSKFMELLHKLETREYTGNKAIAEVELFLNNCNSLQAKWYSRIIRKDLQIGCSESTANKAGYSIPKFEVMLAKDGKNNNKIKSIMHQGGWISPKLDGYRCLAIKYFDDVTLYSRNGKEYTNFPDIIESIKKLPFDQLVLDGEIMSNDFNSMQQSAFASKRGTAVGDVKYHIFDCIPYDEWNSGDFKSPAFTRFARKAELDSVFAKLNIKDLKIVTHIFTDNIDTIFEKEREFIEEGYEGAMLLPYNCPYYQGRQSNKLMKFKTMKSMDCTITGIYEGTNKYEGKMGGLNLLQENNIMCDCGSGFNDIQREEFFSNSSFLIGRIAEIKYQELTPDGVMRFPIFMRFRDRGLNTGKI